MKIAIMILVITTIVLSISNILMAVMIRLLHQNLASLKAVVRKHQQCIEIVNKIFKADVEYFKATENLDRIRLLQSELAGRS